MNSTPGLGSSRLSAPYITGATSLLLTFDPRARRAAPGPKAAYQQLYLEFVRWKYVPPNSLTTRTSWRHTRQIRHGVRHCIRQPEAPALRPTTSVLLGALTATGP